jgi:hypothetical protein
MINLVGTGCQHIRLMNGLSLVPFVVPFGNFNGMEELHSIHIVVNSLKGFQVQHRGVQ